LSTNNTRHGLSCSTCKNNINISFNTANNNGIASVSSCGISLQYGDGIRLVSNKLNSNEQGICLRNVNNGIVENNNIWSKKENQCYNKQILNNIELNGNTCSFDIPSVKKKKSNAQKNCRHVPIIMLVICMSVFYLL